MPRHKMFNALRRGRVVMILTAVFGLVFGLTLVLMHSPGLEGANTVALYRPSLPARSFLHDGLHSRYQHLSASPPPSSPTSAPSSPTSTQVMPTGVPASRVGKLLLNDTGDDLASWPRQQRGTGGTMTHSNGVLDLSTSGADADGYSIISPNSYTSGIFEARVYFPSAANGKIADWPAFWLSSAWSGAVSWPAGGEMDLAEGLGGDLCVTYHYGPNGTPESTMPFSVTSAPGWHVVTGVWSTGKWDIYYDGRLVKTISRVVVNHPMNIIFTAYQGNHGNQPGARSTLDVSYLRVWRLANP
jgi:Glycosyl hydrolases family 16